MKFMVFVKLTGNAASDYENGKMPEQQDISTMMAFNQQLVEAGVMLDGQGFQPTSKGLRVDFASGQPVVTDGPFAETTELIGGYWIWNVGSREEAAEWAAKCPMQPGDVLELRQIFEMDDFSDAIGPDEAAQLEEIEQKMAARSNA